MEEFYELVGTSFHGMVHPEDVERVEWEIRQQIQHSDKNMDFTQYRIIRKDGEVRWIDDCGHLEDSGFSDGTKLFYVFISDITKKITDEQKEKLLKANQMYNILINSLFFICKTLTELFNKEIETLWIEKKNRGCF